MTWKMTSLGEDRNMIEFKDLQPFEKRNMILQFLNSVGSAKVAAIAKHIGAELDVVSSIMTKLKKYGEVAKGGECEWVALAEYTVVKRVYSTRAKNKEPGKGKACGLAHQGNDGVVRLLDRPPYPNQGGRGAVKPDVRRGCSLS